MARTTTDDKPNKRLGDKLSNIRQKRGLSRSGLIDKVHTILPAEDPLRRAITDSSVREIEEGNRVYISRAILETLIIALGCSTSERLELMLAADKNIFAAPDGTMSTTAEILMRGIEAIYYSDSIVQTQIEILLNNRNVSNLNEDELFQILETIMEMASARRKRERKYGSSVSTRIGVR
jgi:transcriptional regulator with XRE-family HTH domain